ncbi:P-loop containing nucleoside triphosphate hydrolase protein [Dipodascopsis tothii]|uniref:P-loop containing nucleoside triphosphate hydrolase protein n=1 Tax=Dipodascopsis tothii TaxID=44089 RepID=UPI0034CD3E6C
MVLCSDSEGWRLFSADYLNFTPCVLEAALPLAVGAATVATAGTQIWRLAQSPRVRLPRQWPLHVKLVLLAVVAAAQTAYARGLARTGAGDVRVAGAAMAVAATATVAALVRLEHARAPHATAAALFGLLAALLLGLARTCSLLQRELEQAHPELVATTVVANVALAALLVVEGYVSSGDDVYAPVEDTSEGVRLDRNANAFSRLTFSYFTPLMMAGYRDSLTEDDVPALDEAHKTAVVRDRFDRVWTAETARRAPSVVRALVRAYFPAYLVAMLFRLPADLLAYVQPLLLRRLILFASTFATPTPRPASDGVVLAAGMFATAIAQSMFRQQFMNICFMVVMDIKSSLTSLIYKKSMRLSNDGRMAKSTGDIVNLMVVDIAKIQDFVNFFPGIWSSPIQIAVCLVNLHALVGNSMWSGVAITVFTIVLSTYISRLTRALQKTQMKVKDQRTRLTGEILVSIKSIKLYAWEQAFIDRLREIRNNAELVNLRKKGFLQALINFMSACTPFMVSCSTFAFFVWTSPAPLTIDIVFPAVSLFGLLTDALTNLRQAVTQWFESAVSTQRLHEFLLEPELQDDAVARADVPAPYSDAAPRPADVAVAVADGTFAWSSAAAAPVLAGVSFDARVRDFVCIVGRVGSGKSALLQALLGDIVKVRGDVFVRGHVAYCAQNPWIMNGTVKDNILFGKRFDAEFYQQTVAACALVDDFAVLPDGDETVVGEKGITLSGGQKARVSLARAVYARADVYVLDDPLSAVDHHVGKHIIDNVLSRRGLLASKTKIMATNSIPVLAYSDRILMLKDGRIAETGVFASLVDERASAIYQLISEYGHVGAEDASDSDTAVEGGDSVANSTTIDPLEALDTLDPLDPLGLDDPLATADELSDEDLPKRAFGHKLRRASTASFRKPALADDGPARKSGQKREHSEKGRVKLAVYKEYMQAANTAAVVAFGLLVILSNALSVSGNVWLKRWAEANSVSGTNASISKFLSVYFVLGISSAIASLLYTLVLWLFCTIRASRVLHDKMLLRVIYSPMSFFDTTPVGRVINRFTADVSRVDEGLARVFSNFSVNLFRVVFSIGVIAVANPVIIFLIVPIAVVYAYCQRIYVSTSRELKRMMSIALSPIYAHFQETLNGVSTIRAYRQDRRFTFIIDAHSDFHTRSYMASLLARRWLAIRVETLAALIIFATALLLIAAIATRRLSAGLLGLTMSYAFQITEALGRIVRMTVEVELATVSVERILEYVKLPSEAPRVIEGHRPRPTWPEAGAVEFHDYSTRYRPGLDLVLRNVSLKVRPGEKIGIVGRTGAGKSSLTLALFRMIEPAGGYVSIDRLNTSTIGLYDLRSQLSIIPQDSQALEGSVRDNLDPGRAYTDEQLWHVLELSHLRAHVAGLDGGLYAKMLEGGSNFSVGQRQLISLARALLNSSKVLVLDEATAAVDFETDHIIQETIRTEFKDRTILTIAHRLNTIIDSDRIVVLAGGRVAEFDTPQRLLADPGSMFYALCKQGGVV